MELLKIIVTTPTSATKSELYFSALKRIKTFLRNTMNKDRLNIQVIISVNNDIIHNISNFDEKAIKNFAK